MKSKLLKFLLFTTLLISNIPCISCNSNDDNNKKIDSEIAKDIEKIENAFNKIVVDYKDKNQTLVNEVKIDKIVVDNSKIEKNIKISKKLILDQFNKYSGDIFVEILLEYKNQKISKIYKIYGFITENFNFHDFINRIEIDINNELKKYSATNILPEHIIINDDKNELNCVYISINENDIKCNKNNGYVEVNIKFTNKYTPNESLTKKYQISGFNIYKFNWKNHINNGNELISFIKNNESIKKIQQLTTNKTLDIHIYEGKFYTNDSFTKESELVDIFKINKHINPLWINTINKEIFIDNDKKIKVNIENVIGYKELNTNSTPISIFIENDSNKKTYYLKWYFTKNDNSLDKLNEYKLMLFEE
ncbi:hypothetical protein [Mycoplasma elephantis]|uniref:hypothetical protein n=1 Tax=Mycoplasma elephantis TaxID=114882 RepID=UPI000487C1BA|nr:hypothetical protein [Mycoplasma elephantis]